MRASVIGATGFAGAELLRLDTRRLNWRILRPKAARARILRRCIRICAGALTKNWYP